jgi:hypothetical protein
MSCSVVLRRRSDARARVRVPLGSPLHWIEVCRSYDGPLNRTFAALDQQRQAALTAELIDLLEQHDRSRDRTLVLPCEYLEAVIVKI